MEDASAIGEIGPRTAGRAEQRGASRTRPDLRRWLQLALGAAWIVDAGLQSQPFMFSKAFGAGPARLGWLVLWDSLVYFAMASIGQAPQDLHDAIAAQAAGEPRWLKAITDLAAAAVAHRGPQASAVLAVLLGLVAIGVFLPPPAARASLILAILLAAAMWVGGQALGGVLTGQGTDPNSGPLLALLAVAYWPRPVGPEPDSRTWNRSGTKKRDGAARA